MTALARFYSTWFGDDWPKTRPRLCVKFWVTVFLCTVLHVILNEHLQVPYRKCHCSHGFHQHDFQCDHVGCLAFPGIVGKVVNTLKRLRYGILPKMLFFVVKHKYLWHHVVIDDVAMLWRHRWCGRDVLDGCVLILICDMILVVKMQFLPQHIKL